MELVTVGTGTVAPSARRTAPCHWVGRGELRILLDCGAVVALGLASVPTWPAEVVVVPVL